MTFHYSGNKKRLSPLLRKPVSDIVIEPFAGSAGYSLYYKPSKVILFENNTDIYNLWNWLITATTIKDLEKLESLKVSVKTDIRTLNLPKPEETLFRLTCASVYVGQLSSWIAYPQNSVNFSFLKENLDYIKNNITLGGKDFRESLSLKGTFFIDPPYVGTHGNYKDKSKKLSLDNIEISDITNFIDQLTEPIIFTYGTDAPTIFPQYDWVSVLEKKVPRIRTGGTSNRIDYVCYKNFS